MNTNCQNNETKLELLCSGILQIIKLSRRKVADIFKLQLKEKCIFVTNILWFLKSHYIIKSADFMPKRPK